MLKKMKPGKTTATAKVITSNSQFNALWDPFLFNWCRRSTPVGTLTFSPDVNNITDAETMFLAGFTQKVTTAEQHLTAYKEDSTPILLQEGNVPSLKRKLTSMIEDDSTDPALQFTKVQKTSSNPFSLYTRDLREAEIEALIAMLGPLETKRMTLDKTHFRVNYIPSKFQITITFNFKPK